MNLAIKNASGMLENVVVVRYFNFNGGKYLIFTKNEMDDAGYQKLYISKINNMMGNTITDDVEWNLVRDTIKVIAKANKDNTVLPVQDLNEAEINGIQIVGQKPFKLTTASVALLGANKNNVLNVQETVVTENIVQPEVTNVSAFESQPIPATPIVPDVQNVSPTIPSAVNSNNNITTSDALFENNLGTIPPVTDLVDNNSVIQSVELPVPPVVNNTIPEPMQTVFPQTVEVNVAPAVNTMETPQEMAPNNLFDFPASTPVAPVQPAVLESNPVVPNVVEPSVDYKKLYDEQTLKLNTLTAELDKYKNIIEQLKNILK